MRIKELVENDNIATFNSYRCGVFYYNVYTRIKIGESNFIPCYQNLDRYIFPIPIEDLGNATLNHTEKAITLMRYIRKAMEEKTLTLIK